MKPIFFIWGSSLFFNIINSFKPFIINISYKTNRIIKSLSGILKKLSFLKFEDNNPNSIIEMNCDTDCEIGYDLEKCETIIPGYMEHEPKRESLKKHKS
jgi:hypothetical protein